MVGSCCSNPSLPRRLGVVLFSCYYHSFQLFRLALLPSNLIVNTNGWIYTATNSKFFRWQCMTNRNTHKLLPLYDASSSSSMDLFNHYRPIHISALDDDDDCNQQSLLHDPMPFWETRIIGKLTSLSEDPEQKETENDVLYSSSSSMSWYPIEGSSRKPPKSVQETWRWCCNFVIPLSLCPWAYSSVHSPSLSIVCVSDRDSMENSIRNSALWFRESIDRNELDPTVAIVFIVCEDKSWDFVEFYNWFCDFEDWLNWGTISTTVQQGQEESEEDISNFITLAPFHHEWTFGEEEDSPSLHFEKKTPYPTVTLVWTDVIDSAGPIVTDKIAKQNEKTLRSKSCQELTEMYEQGVFQSSARSDLDEDLS
jgi:hypothetical protein